MTRPRPRPVPAAGTERPRPSAGRSEGAAGPALTEPHPSPGAPGAPASTDGDRQPAAPRRSRVRPALLMSALVLVVAALAVANVVLLSRRDHDSDLESAREAALASARTRLPAVLSYDYRSIDTFAKTAPANLTGHFRTSYEEFIRTYIAPSAPTSRVVTKAVVRSAGVLHASTGSVIVLVLLDQATTSAATGSTPRYVGSRVRVTMRHTGGRWLISDIGQT